MNSDRARGASREAVLAELAECYYLRSWTQQKIADTFGLTRSTVSRMLKEAFASGIVDVRIRGRENLDPTLADRLVEAYGLDGADVVVERDSSELLASLGTAGALALRALAFDGMTIGVTWGSTVLAVATATHGWQIPDAKVVQLAGSLGASAGEYDSANVVRTLASALGAQPMLLSAPLLVEDSSMVQRLMANPSNRATFEEAGRADLVIVGIGTIDPKSSTLHLGGHLGQGELRRLQREGAVGDVCGQMIDAEGQPIGKAFSSRQVNLSRERLLRVPTRLAVAGGIRKVPPLRGALLAGYISHLVTTSSVAAALLGENRSIAAN